MSLLPPNATPLERAFEKITARISAIPVSIADLWNPATCPVDLLPWLGWGLSIDFWDSAWSEAEKRAAIAGCIAAQRRKGTRASLREVLDRFDPLISLVEWFEDKDTLPPHTFRLELPLAAESAVQYDEMLVAALLRDIAAVKPLRSHMSAVFRLKARTEAFLLSGGHVAGFTRMDSECDLAAPLNSSWANYLQTEQGEPIRSAEGPFLVES